MAGFVEPPWANPLDAARVLQQIPTGATIAGMFFLALLEGAQRRQVELPFPRERYLPFGFYPISEFAPLLVAAAERFYPELPLRQGLRRIGTSGPVAFLGSTLGKVTLGASEGAHAMVAAIAKTYAINVKPSRCDITETNERSIIVRVEGVPYFLDSHHVGVFEGTLHYAGVQGTVLIQSYSDSAADLKLSW
jgi:uncharacterized protein (TIGR02265 family)